MPALQVSFEGVFVHLAQSSTGNSALPVRYRVSAPSSTSLNPFKQENLGSLAPSILINGQTFNGPAVVTVTDGLSGTPSLPPVPHLQPLASASQATSSIAFATFPTTANGIFLELLVDGEWPTSPPILNFENANLSEELSISVQTSSTSTTTIDILALNSIAFVNLPIDANVSANNPETLLGFFSVNDSIPSNAVPPPSDPEPHSAIRIERWVDPSQPGCSNSQWP